MWVFVTFAYLIPAVATTIQILSPSSAYCQQESSNDGYSADGVAAHTSPPISAEPA